MSTRSFTTALQNAGKAHIYGAELEVEAAITNSFQIFGNLSELRAKYDDVGAAQGITVNSTFERAPKLTYSMGASYRQDIRDLHTTTTVNWSWQDHQYSAPEDVFALNLPSYGILNLRFDLSSPEKAWNLGLFVTNLTNTISYIDGNDYTTAVGTIREDIGRPREFGASITYKFGQ
jgi:iron complex outermembrane recepter protein